MKQIKGRFSAVQTENRQAISKLCPGLERNFQVLYLLLMELWKDQRRFLAVVR